MKRFLILLLLLAISIAVFAGGFAWWSQNSNAPSQESEKVRVVIPKGESASQIGEILQNQGVIKNSFAFKVYVQVKGISQSIKAGEYRLPPNLTLEQVVAELLKGPSLLWVTVPEGLRKEEVVKRYVDGLEMNPNQVQKFIDEFLQDPEAKEGFLFPDTYLFPREATGSVVVKRMREIFDAKVTEEFAQEINKSKYSPDELITLASIIERETRSTQERAIVAGILYNRLEIGMGLQTDATVQYAVASAKCKVQSTECENWWPVLTKEDLQIESPYNSYKYKGLPPAPIANPGVFSIKAVLFPEKNDYLYYLHDSEGKIHYASTLEEHNENVRIYLGK